MSDISSSRSITESDKHYWHRYTEFYASAFQRVGEIRRIIEFGIFHGASTRWLSECFPGSEIRGLDILPLQPDWPISKRITYRQVDQGDRAAVKVALAEVAGEVDMIIEDGSHIPQHQATCLAEGIRRVRRGGLYILEDICTSHPLQAMFAHYSVVGGRRRPNALNVVLAIQHLKDTGQILDKSRITMLSDPEFLSEADVRNLFEVIDRVEIYKRTQLPLRCFSCGGTDFNYVEWVCRCGVDLYDPANSMTALVWKR